MSGGNWEHFSTLKAVENLGHVYFHKLSEQTDSKEFAFIKNNAKKYDRVIIVLKTATTPRELNIANIEYWIDEEGLFEVHLESKHLETKYGVITKRDV